MNASYPDFVTDSNLPAYLIIYVVVFSCCSVIGTLGNILVIVVTVAAKALRNSRNAFIVSLAIADLMVSSVTMPSSIVGALLGRQWFANRPSLCAFTSTMCAPGCVASMHSIAWIAISRYYYIGKYPVYMQWFTKEKIAIYIGSIWLLGFMVHLPNHLGWGNTQYSFVLRYCTLDTDLYSYALFYACVLVSAIVLAFVFYSKIYIVLRRSKLSKSLIASKGVYRKKGDDHATRKAQSGMAVEIKLMKTSFKIFIMFIVTWLPLCVILLLPRDIPIPPVVSLYAGLLAHSNSTMNFLVYFFENNTFRRAAIDLIKTLFKKPNTVSFVNESLFIVRTNNRASRIDSHSQAHEINVSEAQCN